MKEKFNLVAVALFLVGLFSLASCKSDSDTVTDVQRVINLCNECTQAMNENPSEVKATKEDYYAQIKAFNSSAESLSQQDIAELVNALVVMDVTNTRVGMENASGTPWDDTFDQEYIDGFKKHLLKNLDNPATLGELITKLFGE